MTQHQCEYDIFVAGTGVSDPRTTCFLGVTALRGFLFILVHFPSAPFASKEVPAVRVSPVLASLGSVLARRRDDSIAQTAGLPGQLLFSSGKS